MAKELAEQKPVLSSVTDLFKQSWELFKLKIKPLLLLNLVTLAASVIVAFIVGASFFPLITSFFSTGGNWVQTLTQNLSIIYGYFGLIVMGVVILAVIGLVNQIATVLIISSSEVKLIEVIKRSFVFMLPLIGASFISFFLVVGGYGLFIIPGIYISILLSFVSYEIILNGQNSFGAIKNSISMVSGNFWGILGRVLLIGLISMLPQILLSKNDSNAFFVSVFNGIFGVVFGWFAAVYVYTIYKQVSRDVKVKNLTWLWIVAVIGWVLIILLMSTVGQYAFSQLEKYNQKSFESFSDGNSINAY